jgi:hypothetical protein
MVKEGSIWQTSWPIAMQSAQPESTESPSPTGEAEASVPAQPQPAGSDAQAPREIGGRAGPDPTRFGDWEKNGRCIDF